MGHQKNPGVRKQARVDLWLALVDVQADGGDATGVESVDQGSFVHDGAASRVDDGDAGFHDGELLSGDQVSCLRLGTGRRIISGTMVESEDMQA